MTIYEKQLAQIIEEKYGDFSPMEIMEKLIEMGVVDYTRCKILAVREYVEQLLRKGEKKTDAMWYASEKFACTYEYIRKCMYYYIDVNIC